MFPKIIISQNKLQDNIQLMIKKTKENNIPFFTFVIKSFAGNKEILNIIKNTDIQEIGDSRIQNLIKFKELECDKVLLRIPMLSEVESVIKYSDISLNSEIKTIRALNQEAIKQNKKHEIIIMFDLGDLREGIYYNSNYFDLIREVIDMDNIILKGIGTNLTCYGGLVPNKNILMRLVKIKNEIENKFSIKLSIISGGNSSSVTLFNKDEIPSEINHLRLGESIIFGKETSYSTNIPDFNYDVFTFQAEIVELKEKPSYPDGEISINSFGEKPDIEDKGLMLRAICAIGKQDVILDNLKPVDENLEIIGGSSDHLIIQIKKGIYKLGDIIDFSINYPALVHLMNSNYVEKEFK